MQKALCCCLQSSEAADGLTLNINFQNACCQKTVTIREETPKTNLFRSKVNSIFRRNKTSIGNEQGTPQTSERISQQGVDLSTAQTSQTKIQAEEIHDARRECTMAS